MGKLNFMRFVGMAMLLFVLVPVNVFAQKYVVVLNKTFVYDEPKSGASARMNQFDEDVSLDKGKVFELVAAVGGWYQVKGNFCGEGSEDGYIRVKDCFTDGEALAEDANKKMTVNNNSNVRLSFSLDGNNTCSAKITPVDAAATGLNDSLSGISQGNILLLKEKVYEDVEEIKYTVVKLNGRVYVYQYGYGVL